MDAFRNAAPVVGCSHSFARLEEVGTIYVVFNGVTSRLGTTKNTFVESAGIQDEHSARSNPSIPPTSNNGSMNAKLGKLTIAVAKPNKS